MRVDKVEDYQSLVDAEWQIIYKKLDACIAAGVQIVLSRLAIGDLATQLAELFSFLFKFSRCNNRYFADRGVFCAGRVPKDDLARVAKATGAQVRNKKMLNITAAHKRMICVCRFKRACETLMPAFSECAVCLRSARFAWFFVVVFC